MTILQLAASPLGRMTWPGKALAGVTKTATRWASEQAARRALHALDDWMLADMGIGRSEIKHAVRHGRSN
jgi:uncharacterized protein YjiS (DUF1127 family)